MTSDYQSGASAMREIAAQICYANAEAHESVAGSAFASQSAKMHAKLCAAVCRNRTFDIRALPIPGNPASSEGADAIEYERAMHKHAATSWEAELKLREVRDAEIATLRAALEKIAAMDASGMSLGDQIFAVTSARAALQADLDKERGKTI